MYFAFSDEQTMIRDAANDLAQRFAPISRVRKLVEETGEPHCQDLWRNLADAGFLGTLVPEVYGGAGLGFMEIGCVLEAMGAALATVPCLGTAVLAVETIKTLGNDRQRRQWLPEIANGKLIVCPILGNSAGQASLSIKGDTVVLNGRFAPVFYGQSADLFLVEAHDVRRGENVIVPVSPRMQGLKISDMPLLDRTRRFAMMEFVNVQLPDGEEALLPINMEQASRLQAAAVAATASEMLGGALEVVEMGCSYARERQQFGQPIGAFQAVKHMLSDQHVALEGARSAVYAALWSLDEDPENASVVAAMAKAVMSDVYLKIASENIQIHGGMGFTTEAHAHLYLKRAQIDRMTFGTPDAHYQFLAERLEALA